MELNLVVGFFLGIVGALGLVFVGLTARAGNFSRVLWAINVAGKTHFDPALVGKIDTLLGNATPAPAPAAAPTTPKPEKPAAPVPPPAPPVAPLQLLTLLQSDARLLDFLMEDISGAQDAQIGSAVKKIHSEAQAALKKVLTIEPVMAGNEGENVTVPVGFDPSAIRVLGNVTGQPPYRGELNHPGWKVTAIKLNPLPQGQDPMVIQPAEVTLS